MRYNLLSCLPRADLTGCTAPSQPRLLLPSLRSSRSPSSPSGITTVVPGHFHRQDFHLLERQLSSLHERIKAKGIYRDPVRSSRSHMVKASGLRWLCAMVLAEIPWARRVWALPFLTALCPSQRYHQQQGQRHKSLPQWAGQLIGLIHRWLPERQVVVVTDSTYAVSVPTLNVT